MNQIYNVTELNLEIKSILEQRYPFIRVSGEISNLRKPYSGHLYFALKDRDAQIKAVLFKLQQRYLSEMPKDGEHGVLQLLTDPTADPLPSMPTKATIYGTRSRRSR